jgi:6-phosphogluconolactonase
MNRELVVTDNIPEVASEVFLQIRPRTTALAGADTPQPTHRRLAELDYDWSQVEVFFGDERCVPPDHKDSNYRLAWENLLSKVPARVHRMPGETCDPLDYERQMRSVFGEGLPRFDLIFLGIGADGHTASLFPGDPALAEKQRLVVKVERPDYSRLTLTLPVLSAAKVVLFLISGSEKREALRRMLADEDIPAARVSAERIIVVTDPAAAPE